MTRYFIGLLLLCSHVAFGQSLAELERQLDSLLGKRQKSEVVVALSYGNNPAYGNKTTNFEQPLILKPFLSPSLTWYHKSGFYGGASAYYLFNTQKDHWFEWDATAGYDYTKNSYLITGISYTHYFLADSTDVPVTPIKNELFAYFYYQLWWLQPGISVDYGWGSHQAANKRQQQTIRGNDFNVIAAVRHPFIFTGLLTPEDALLFTPSMALTMGTANYYSQLTSFRYIVQSAKMLRKRVLPGREFSYEDHNNFEARAVDVTLNVSYLFGKLTLSPSYTVFKLFNGDQTGLMNYFSARLSCSF